jgi:pimeloyl-ACP methyl ester carboxylesterase
MLRGAWRLWFMPVIATPGLGARLLGRGNQPLARYLLETDVAEDAFSAEDREAFVAPLRQPERAGWVGALPRADAARDAPHRHGGYEAYADDLTVEPIEGAAHFLADERPDAVADRVLAFFDTD